MRVQLISAAIAMTLLCAPVGMAHAQESQTGSAQTAWRLLDYIAVDYPGAVEQGRVISDAEYAEMIEFSAQVTTRVEALPATPAQATLVSDAKALAKAIDRKVPSQEVAQQARTLGSALLSAYPMSLAPPSAPDLAQGATLYRTQCSACHGASGRGDGISAAVLNPPPIAFVDRDRARERSVFGLYQVIHQGLDDTAMASFGHLPIQDQWALAFYVGRFAFTDEEALKGKQLWESDASLRKRFPDLSTLTQVTPAALTSEIGDDNAMALTAYLRRHPEVVVNQGNGASLAVARARLHESLIAYEAGDQNKATDLALAAYLDGFEPIEPILTARDPALMRRVEAAMGELRGKIGRSTSSDELRSQFTRVEALLEATERVLAPQHATNSASFTAAFTILLREGLEALLIVVAMIAFLNKAERKDVLIYVHGGWIAALVAGGLTWLVATHVIAVSGASRELTEGFGSIVASVVLVSVGLWMHGKAQADAWQHYIREKLSKALSRQSAWFLFLLSFLVVYREVFETILFFAALWSQGGRVAMLAGALTALAILAGIAWALLKYSRRLPIAQFFSLSSILMAVLSVVLAGKGIAALQEAGMIDIQPVSGLPQIPMLGFYPTIAGIGAQLILVAVLVVGFHLTKGKSR